MDDRPRFTTMAAQWDQVNFDVIHPDSSAEERAALREAFYAGGIAALLCIAGRCPGPTTIDQVAAAMRAVNDELHPANRPGRPGRPPASAG